jgi:7,8-dihydropterin-6-yl-methyl-4-(beta-D-ribofuranosyl)aminobenzene 5'-phosphate synthase
MQPRRRAIVTIAVLAAGGILWVGMAGSDGGRRGSTVHPETGGRPEVLALDDIRITVVYDNNPGGERLRAEWGFSCLIEGAEKTILFDTGGDAPVLLSNMESLSVDPRSIDTVVLSHNHGDHTGGMSVVLLANPGITAYIPESFPGGFKDRVRQAGAEVVEVEAPREICGGVYSVGQMGSTIKEQSLALDTDRGVIVITGCAHPGIVSIVKKAKEVTGRDILFAMGGFHLSRAGDGELREIIHDLREAGLAYAGPCHCSGDRARQLFSEAFGENYVEISVGTVLEGGRFE